MTFSIVAQVDDAFGVAVASRFVAVGSVVPGTDPGVGAVATQAMAKVSYKPDVLRLLSSGLHPDEAVREVTGVDPESAHRQLGVVSPLGEATFTGSACLPWAGGVTGRDSGGGYAIQGNILTGPEVVEAMRETWLATASLPFARRLTEALLAGDRAGGDRRGRQGAALYAVQPGAGYDASGVLVDLRVDDDPEAATALARLLDEHELVFGAPEDVSDLTGDLAAEVADRLAALGYRDDSVDQALTDWASVRNVEMRLTPDGIDGRVLAELRRLTTHPT